MSVKWRIPLSLFVSSDIGTKRRLRQILTLQGWRESAEKNRSGALERQKGPIDSGHRPGKGQNDTRSVISFKVRRGMSKVEGVGRKLLLLVSDYGKE